jgi:N utilization substance protein B
MTKFNPQARRKAREFALQALYQWEVSKDSITDIEAQFLQNPYLVQADIPYFRELVHEIPAHREQLDNWINPYLDRPQAELNPVELAILHIGTYELGFRPEIPYKVIINEALELAKNFGATEGHKYVNGVLDKVSHKLREAEIK